MIAEKSQTARELIDRISATAPKVSFIEDSIITRAFMFLERNGIPNNKVEDYKYCNMDAILRKEFKSLTQKFTSPQSIAAHKLADTITIVVVNGKFSPELSDKVILKGVHISSFK